MALRLGEISWVACASPDYLALRGEPDSPETLANHDCVMFEGLYSTNAWTFGRNRQVQEISIRPRLSVNSADAAIAAAIGGAGVTRVLSYQVAEPVARGALKLILRAFEPETLPTHLLYAGQSLIPLKLRAFLDFAGPRLRTSLLGLSAERQGVE
jgi:DNA-binding transcriptional LysR family regulator